MTTINLDALELRARNMQAAATRFMVVSPEELLALVRDARALEAYRQRISLEPIGGEESIGGGE